MGNLQVGTCGWQQLEGQDFYPEDMPVEWRLDFYSNAFRVVLVPESEWMAWESVDVEACIDGVEGEFEFYLRLDDEVTAANESQISYLKQRLGDLLKGLVVFSESILPATKIASLPVSLVSSALQLPGWVSSICGHFVSGNPIGYCETLPTDGKKQAGLLKDFMQTHPQNANNSHNSDALAFFIGGDSINMTQVSNLKVVGEFLGY